MRNMYWANVPNFIGLWSRTHQLFKCIGRYPHNWKWKLTATSCQSFLGKRLDYWTSCQTFMGDRASSRLTAVWTSTRDVATSRLGNPSRTFAQSLPNCPRNAVTHNRRCAKAIAREWFFCPPSIRWFTPDSGTSVASYGMVNSPCT